MKLPTIMLTTMCLLFSTPSAALWQDVGRGAAVEDDYLVGAWSDHDDCSELTYFYADGTFVASTGGVGQWAIKGDRLILEGDGRIELEIRRIDDDHLATITEAGVSGGSTRCDATPDDQMPTV